MLPKLFLSAEPLRQEIAELFLLYGPQLHRLSQDNFLPEVLQLREFMSGVGAKIDAVEQALSATKEARGPVVTTHAYLQQRRDFNTLIEKTKKNILAVKIRLGLAKQPRTKPHGQKKRDKKPMRNPTPLRRLSDSRKVRVAVRAQRYRTHRSVKAPLGPAGDDSGDPPSDEERGRHLS